MTPGTPQGFVTAGFVTTGLDLYFTISRTSLLHVVVRTVPRSCGDFVKAALAAGASGR
jgi:hypothetical protein